jgi:hypothetical protein
MSFIQFNNRLINVGWIRQVVINSNKYIIHCNTPTYSGFMLAGSGLISSDPSIIVIDKEKDANDYEVMTKWMKTL